MTESLGIGSQLGPYHIEAELGRGGMGVVYRARQETPHIQRTVALKVLSPSLTDDKTFRQRFANESLHAASIDHEHIIPIMDAGEINGHLYLAMRYVEGSDLATLLKRVERLGAKRALGIVRQAGRALDAAHRRGLVHRDVKPANILIASGEGRDATDHVYLADFGLTKASSTVTDLTMPGHFLGTLDYIAPEQIDGERPTAAVDIYALGCVLYQCLVGLPPFVRDSKYALMAAHKEAPPPRASTVRSDLPPPIDRVISKALAKKPTDRYGSCAELVAAATAALRASSAQPRIESPAQPPPPTDPAMQTALSQRPMGPPLSGRREPERRPTTPPVAGLGWWEAKSGLVAIGIAAVVIGLVIGAVLFR